jgi:hypothetical protein
VVRRGLQPRRDRERGGPQRPGQALDRECDRRNRSAGQRRQAGVPRRGGRDGQDLHANVHCDGQLRHLRGAAPSDQSLRHARGRAEAGARHGASGRDEALAARRRIRHRRVHLRVAGNAARYRRRRRPWSCARRSIAVGLQLGAQPFRAVLHRQADQPRPVVRDRVRRRGRDDRRAEHSRQPAEHHSRDSRHRRATAATSQAVALRRHRCRGPGCRLDSQRDGVEGAVWPSPRADALLPRPRAGAIASCSVADDGEPARRCDRGVGRRRVRALPGFGRGCVDHDVRRPGHRDDGRGRS